MKKRNKPTIISLYPKTEKPPFVFVGAKVMCWGDGNDVFTIEDVIKSNCSSMLYNVDGWMHGRESWSKLREIK